MGFLWPHGCPIIFAELGPVGVHFVRNGVFCSSFFVDVNAKAGSFIYIHKPIFHIRRAGENFECLFVEKNRLLNTEVPDGEVDMRIGGVANG